MKQLIGLTEGDLHQIVENSIKKVIRENDVNQRGYISKDFKKRTESPEAMHMPWGYFDNEMPYKNSEVTEGDLHQIVENCVRKALNELAPQTYQNYANGRWQQSMNKRGYSPALSRKYDNYKQQMQGYKSYVQPNMNNDEYDEYTNQLWRNGLQSQSREGQDMANGWKGDGHGGLEY